MQGASRSALAAAREVLEQVLTQDADRGQLGEELLQVAGVVSGNAVLRRALADPSREGSEKADLVNRLFGGKVSEPAQRVAATVAAQRWASEGDLTAALEAFGIESILAQAEAAGRLSQVEDELFRFGRIVDGASDLRSALTDRRAPAESKTQVVRSLLEGRSAPETVRLAELAATHRITRFDHAIESYLQIAARRQEQLTATITTAVPLTEQQRDRLTRTLSQHHGRNVHANEVVDPTVVGGIRVEIGDEIIDGTILSRLDDARRRMTS